MIFGEECKCRCHEGKNDIKHIMPCCYQCGACGKKIKHNFEEHEKKCYDYVDYLKTLAAKWMEQKNG